MIKINVLVSNKNWKKYIKNPNQYLKKTLIEIETDETKVFFPSMQFCTDNGAMIAYAGLLRYEKKMYS